MSAHEMRDGFFVAVLVSMVALVVQIYVTHQLHGPAWFAFVGFGVLFGVVGCTLRVRGVDASRATSVASDDREGR